MQPDIYITELEGNKREIRIPWLPDKIKYTSNGTRFISYELLDEGEFKIPSGENLGMFSWDGTLPGEGRKDILPFLRGDWIAPIKYQEIFSYWRVYGTKLRLLITGTPVNHNVNIENYDVEYSGAFGDYNYSIKFVNAKKIEVSSIKAEATTQSQRTETVSSQSTHTVAQGDSLWKIALKYYGSGLKHTEIYNANKEIIESTAKNHKKPSSSNGHWIFPGTVLTIP